MLANRQTIDLTNSEGEHSGLQSEENSRPTDPDDIQRSVVLEVRYWLILLLYYHRPGVCSISLNLLLLLLVFVCLLIYPTVIKLIMPVISLVSPSNGLYLFPIPMYLREDNFELWKFVIIIGYVQKTIANTTALNAHE